MEQRLAAHVADLPPLQIMQRDASGFKAHDVVHLGARVDRHHGVPFGKIGFQAFVHDDLGKPKMPDRWAGFYSPIALRRATNRRTLPSLTALRASHRSYCCWSAIHRSAVVSKARARRSAIAGLTPARPLSSSESAFRVTPSALAASVID